MPAHTACQTMACVVIPAPRPAQFDCQPMNLQRQTWEHEGQRQSELQPYKCDLQSGALFAMERYLQASPGRCRSIDSTGRQPWVAQSRAVPKTRSESSKTAVRSRSPRSRPRYATRVPSRAHEVLRHASLSWIRATTGSGARPRINRRSDAIAGAG